MQDSLAAKLITSFLREGDWQSSKSDDQQLRSHWLDAILRWIIMFTASALEQAENRNGEFYRLPTYRREGIQMTADATQSAADQVDMFLERYPEYRGEHCRASLHSLKRLAKVADDFARTLNAREWEANSKRQMQMTELSISESRSAIGCKFSHARLLQWLSKLVVVTVLASVFVPISLASSIFGMNIQEINQSGHSIWTFVVCAISMWLLTGLAWLIWQTRRNFKVAKHRILDSEHMNKDQWSSYSMGQRLHRIKSQFHPYQPMGGAKSSLGYWLGFRTFEKDYLSGV